MYFWNQIPKFHKMKGAYINRTIESTIFEAIKYFDVISLTGPRQSGKSTLLTHLFPDCERFSLANLNILEFAKNDPVAFLKQANDKLMFIDEIQKAPELLSYIQEIVDNSSRKFIISGSSNFELLQSVSQSLAGRAGVFELFPMSYAETAGSSSSKDLDTFLFDGLYPAICSGAMISDLFFPSYVKTYIEKDVRELLKIQNLMQFLKFMKLCASRVGAVFNASEIASEVGVDSKTITQWLSILQASYIVTLLPPYYENIPKRLVKSPKLYFCDSGLACYLLDIESSKQLSRDKMRGAIFENFIVSEVIKHRSNKGKEGGVYFYRDSNNNEVDILLKEEGEITAIEVKSSMTYNKSFESSLKKIDSWINTPIKSKTIIYSGDYENTEGAIGILNYSNIGKILG